MAEDFLTELFAAGAKGLLLSRLIREVPVAKPGAGAEWSVPVPGGVIWELLTIAGTLTTSAVVHNATGNVSVLDMDNVRVASVNSTTQQAQNIVGLYTFTHDVTAAYTSGANFVTLPMPCTYALSGWKISSVTGSIDPADQWSNVVLTVREWDETGLMQEIDDIYEQLESYISRRTP